MLADLAFAARHPAHPMNYCRAEIYAGTPLEARMRAAGRLEGTALAPTYRYTDPKVALVWALGSELFAGRCWGEDDLLGSVIRLDHQVAVLDRFYDGPRVRALAASFRAWQVDLNLETAGLFRELVVACGEAPDAADPALRRALAELRRREAPARAARLRQACEYRGALARYAEVSVALGRRHAAAAAAGRRPRGPRHVAAVAAAIGVLGCAVAHDRGVAEAAPPPLDRPSLGAAAAAARAGPGRVRRLARAGALPAPARGARAAVPPRPGRRRGRSARRTGTTSASPRPRRPRTTGRSARRWRRRSRSGPCRPCRSGSGALPSRSRSRISPRTGSRSSSATAQGPVPHRRARQDQPRGARGDACGRRVGRAAHGPLRRHVVGGARQRRPARRRPPARARSCSRTPAPARGWRSTSRRRGEGASRAPRWRRTDAGVCLSGQGPRPAPPTRARRA